jgi:branched-chain amino acid transport system ATP-binding protein
MRESEEDVAFTVDDLVELLGLGAFRDKFVSELSTGSRRIVDLAMSIAHDPKVLLLDEPSSGIAQRETEALGPAAGRHPARDRLRDAHHRARHAAHHRPVRPDRRARARPRGPAGHPDEVLADPQVSAATSAVTCPPSSAPVARRPRPPVPPRPGPAPAQPGRGRSRRQEES